MCENTSLTLCLPIVFHNECAAWGNAACEPEESNAKERDARGFRVYDRGFSADIVFQLLTNGPRMWWTCGPAAGSHSFEIFDAILHLSGKTRTCGCQLTFVRNLMISVTRSSTNISDPFILFRSVNQLITIALLSVAISAIVQTFAYVTIAFTRSVYDFALVNTKTILSYNYLLYLFSHMWLETVFLVAHAIIIYICHVRGYSLLISLFVTLPFLLCLACHMLVCSYISSKLLFWSYNAPQEISTLYVCRALPYSAGYDALFPMLFLCLLPNCQAAIKVLYTPLATFPNPFKRVPFDHVLRRPIVPVIFTSASFSYALWLFELPCNHYQWWESWHY